MTIGSIIFFTWLVGFLTGFAAYFACKVGYKEWIKVIDEEQEEQKKDQRAATLKAVKK